MAARAGPPGGSRRKLIAFDDEVWQALHQLSLDSLKSVQELADEAFADLLRKHRRPVSLKDALRESARLLPANDPSGRRRARKGRTRR
jgi:hypothetical protein